MSSHNNHITLWQNQSNIKYHLTKREFRSIIRIHIYTYTYHFYFRLFSYVILFNILNSIFYFEVYYKINFSTQFFFCRTFFTEPIVQIARERLFILLVWIDSRTVTVRQKSVKIQIHTFLLNFICVTNWRKKEKYENNSNEKNGIIFDSCKYSFFVIWGINMVKN
jgi:hypothetical protein